MRKRHFRKVFVPALAGMVCLFTLSAGGAPIVANFDGGADTEVVDAYPGMAGSGWVASWQRHDRADSDTTVSVTDTNPLTTGSGNYMNIANAGTDASSLIREYQTFGSVDVTQPYTISFDFRIDTWSDELIVLNGRHTSANNSGSTGSNINSWVIRIETNGTFRVFDGDHNSGTVTGTTIPGFDAASGHLYHIQIGVDPTTGSYTTQVGFDGQVWDSVEEDVDLLFRMNEDRWAEGNLFGVRAGGSGTTVSLDNIHIIPEPGTLVLLLAGAGLLAARRRRA